MSVHSVTFFTANNTLTSRTDYTPITQRDYDHLDATKDAREDGSVSID